MNSIISESKMSMTSLEIAELVESNHADVRRSITRLAKRGVIQLPPTAKVENKQSLSPNNKSGAYVFTGDKGKRDSIVVVAQLSPEFTARLVDRWQELEAKTLKPTLPDFTNPAEAARAWASEYEHKQAALAQLEAAQPAIEFHARVGDSDSLHSIDEVAKALHAPPMKFRKLLKTDICLFRKDGLPKQDFINRGYVRVVEKILPHTGKPYPQTFFTGKGFEWVQRKIDHTLLGVEV